MSCRTRSRLLLERTILVSPPTVNRKRNLIVQKKAILQSSRPLAIVPSQEKTLIPVGTLITIVAAVKYARESVSIPTVYI